MTATVWAAPNRRWAGRLAGGLPAGVLFLVVVLAAAGPALAPLDPTASVGGAWAPPSSGHPLGTDGLGRDVLSRLLAGGWPVLVVPTLAVTIATAVGVAVGLGLTVTPGRGRRAGQVLDVFLVVPPLLIFVLVSFAFDRGVLPLVLLVVVLTAPFTARHLRAAADPLLDRGFVEVALASGRSWADVALRELLPVLRRPILAEAGGRFVGAIYLVSSASYLGIVDLPGDADWAAMVAEALHGGAAPNRFAVVVPVLAIAAVAVTVNLSADRWSRA